MPLSQHIENRKADFCFFDDIFRKEFWQAKKLIYRLVRNCIISSGCGTFDPYERYEKTKSVLFTDLEKVAHNISWTDAYLTLPEEIQPLLRKYLKDKIVVSYEMTPGLKKFLADSNYTYIDIRLSSVRFCDDLLLGIDSNSADLYIRAKQLSYSNRHIKQSAQNIKECINHLYPQATTVLNYDDSTIFLGQTDSDASIISKSSSRFLRLGDFKDKIDSIRGPVFYKPHPYASKEHVAMEQETLKYITSSYKGSCMDNIYSLMANDLNISFAAISSGGLLEASLYDKDYTYLHEPIFSYSDADDDVHRGRHLHVTPSLFLDPDYWTYVLGGIEIEELALRMMATKTNRDFFREIHNATWGYQDFEFTRKTSLHKTAEWLKSVYIKPDLDDARHLSLSSVRNLQEEVRTLDKRIDHIVRALKNPLNFFFGRN